MGDLRVNVYEEKIVFENYFIKIKPQSPKQTKIR